MQRPCPKCDSFLCMERVEARGRMPGVWRKFHLLWTCCGHQATGTPGLIFQGASW